MFEPSACSHVGGREIPTLTFRDEDPGGRASSRKR